MSKLFHVPAIAPEGLVIRRVGHSRLKARGFHDSNAAAQTVPKAAFLRCSSAAAAVAVLVRGSQINVTTKSGTNQIHGSAFEFVRNSALGAKNFFDSGSKPIPPFKHNQFDGTIGGPLVIRLKW